jgi:hypothetical protein
VLRDADHASGKQRLTEKTTSLVKILVIGPGVQRSKTLLTLSGATSAIQGSVGASIMPRKADEQASIVVKIRWPPVLGGNLQLANVLL